MQRYIAFLRGINLGKRRVPMSRLKALFAELGFAEVKTFIASGNVVFSSKERNTSKLESHIARHLEASLGYRIDTFVRTMDEVAKIGKVFPEDKAGVTIIVGLFHERLPPDQAKKLAAVGSAEDEFLVVGREYYWLCRVRTSDSKIWTRPEIRELHLPTSTSRNMRTIRKLVAQHTVPARASLRRRGDTQHS